VLELIDVQVSYGAAVALRGISLHVKPGELVCVVGPNGAGKSTLINAIAGLHRVAAGAMTLDGRDLTCLPSHRFCAEGIAVVPEGRRLFGALTVRENLELGSYLPAAKALRQASLSHVCTLFPALAEKLDQPAGALSGGQQQMVAIARALMARPRLLLLDEPSLGLAPVVVDRIYETIRTINQQGVTILLVEQNANYALDVSARGYVLETGKVALTDQSSALRSNEEVQKAYLGT